MRRVLGSISVCLLAACGNNLPTQDQVQDLRILAMRADPPEQAVLVPPSQGLPALAPVTLTALVADPSGRGRSVHAVFSTCAALDPVTQQCGPGTLDYQVVAEVDGVPAPGGAPSVELSAQFTPTWPFVGDVYANDPGHGVGFLPVPLQVAVTAGDESGVAVKAEYLTPPLGNPAHVNPVIPVVTLDGASWDAGTTLPLVHRPDGDAVDPVTPTDLEQAYREQSYSGGVTTFQEDWSYTFYGSAGQFAQVSTGGNSSPNRTGLAQPTTNVWQPATGQAAGPVYFWIIVTDGHGGESWTSRIGQY